MKEQEQKIDAERWKRRSFIAFGVLALGGVAAWRIFRAIRRAHEVAGTQAPLRSVLEFNENVVGAIKSHDHRAPEYPRERAVKNFRVNGDAGVKKPIDPAAWSLHVDRNGSLLEISLDEVRSLPKTEICFEFKCIEGWSEITHWGGVRFADFMDHFKLGTKSGQAPDLEKEDDLFGYAGLVTPDEGYYVGIDMHSALHPQTILAYEHNGLPLTDRHGAPLRLIIPTKYGVKNLKRIGSIAFSDERPPDYWHERGYDYDCAL